MQLELTDVEAEYLRTTLTRVFSELRFEVARTDTRVFRDRLKADEELLRAVLSRLGVGHVP